MEDNTYSLPPYLTTPKARLLSAIDLLSAHDVDDTVFLLLTAMAQSIAWSEEYHERFLKIGFVAAIELYDAAAQNRPFEEVEKDPKNPRNWKGYVKSLTASRLEVSE